MTRKLFDIAGLFAILTTFGILVIGCDPGTNGNTFALSIAVADGSSGMGSVSITSGSPTGNAVGASVTVTATAATGYHFVRWSNNTAGTGSVSASNPYTFTINADTSLCAVFAPDDGNTFALSIAVADGSSGMGSVSITNGSPTGNAVGTSVTVTATAATGYHFVRWSNNIAGMGSVSTNNPYTFTINADTPLCAVFAPDDNVTGIITPEGTWNTDIDGGIVVATFTSGRTWTFTLAPYYSDTGIYTLTGNYGLIHSNTLNADIGMFALTSATTMTMYLVAPNPVTGTFYGTKQVSP
ncbi:MAG: InlB B-repeat-containing protein [Treponema sp.]|jgi:NOL1/NOP2/fmu family ribosome biogenesis protein|nr:InlB B-repeat-containing protein [Treponema sp.]